MNGDCLLLTVARVLPARGHASRHSYGALLVRCERAPPIRG